MEYQKNSGYVCPRQKVSEGDKTEQWFKENVDYLINQAFIGSENNDIMDYYLLDKGEVNEELYADVLRPYYDNSQEVNKINRQSLKHYPILEPIKNLYLGEFLKLPKNFPFAVENSDAKAREDAFLKQAIGKAAFQHSVNLLNTGGVETGIPSKEVDPAEGVKDEAQTNYIDQRVFAGQIIVDKIKKREEYEEVVMRMYEDSLICERAYVYTGFENDKTTLEYVDPNMFWCNMSKSSPYVEDGSGAVRLLRMTLPEIVDRFHSDLKAKDIEWMETENGFGNFKYVGDLVFSTTELDWRERLRTETQGLNINEYHNVFHCVWKGFSEIKNLQYNSALSAKIETTWVPASYKLQPELGDIGFIGSEWVTTVYQGWRIGDELTGLYLQTGEHSTQRNVLTNRSTCKLPYNGRMDLKSLYRNGLPYQLEYNIINMYIRKIMSTDFVNLLVLPKGLQPDNFATDYEWIEFAKDVHVLLVDESAPNAQRAMEMLKNLTSPIADYLRSMIEIRNSIKAELWAMEGLNDQRYGDISNSAGKGTTEQAVFRSTVISLRGIHKFQNLLKKLEQAILDTSKLEVATGVSPAYLDSADSKIKTFDFDPLEFQEAEFSVFAVDASDEQEKIQAANLVLQPMLQNGLAPEGAMEVIDNQGKTGSFTKLKESIKKFSELIRNYETDKQKQASEQQQAVIGKQQELETMKQQFAKELEQMRIDGEMDKVKLQEETKRLIAGMNPQVGIAKDKLNIAKDQLNEQKQSGLRDYILKQEKLKIDREKVKAAKQNKQTNK